MTFARKAATELPNVKGVASFERRTPRLLADNVLVADESPGLVVVFSITWTFVRTVVIVVVQSRERNE